MAHTIQDIMIPYLALTGSTMRYLFQEIVDKCDVFFTLPDLAYYKLSKTGVKCISLVTHSICQFSNNSAHHM